MLGDSLEGAVHVSYPCDEVTGEEIPTLVYSHTPGYGVSEFKYDQKLRQVPIAVPVSSAPPPNKYNVIGFAVVLVTMVAGAVIVLTTIKRRRISDKLP